MIYYLIKKQADTNSICMLRTLYPVVKELTVFSIPEVYNTSLLVLLFSVLCKTLKELFLIRSPGLSLKADAKVRLFSELPKLF
jgi:hypothetical protein